MKLVSTIAGVIYNQDNKILCTKRDVGKYEYVSLKWEFPGGKIEEGESDRQTLERELREELEIKVDISDFYMQIEHDYPDFHLTMKLYKCKLLSDAVKLNVHKDYKWLSPEEMLSLDWAQADEPIAKRLYSER